MRLDLILTMRDIYTKFKDVLPWKISHMFTKTISFNMRTVTSYVMKRVISYYK